MLVSQDQKYWVGFEGVGLRLTLQKKEGVYESWENICMCLYFENRDKLFRKNKRSWLGATKVDGMQLGQGGGLGYDWFAALERWKMTPNNIRYDIWEKNLV